LFSFINTEIGIFVKNVRYIRGTVSTGSLMMIGNMRRGKKTGKLPLVQKDRCGCFAPYAWNTDTRNCRTLECRQFCGIKNVR
jgi:hypothetical protein